MPAAILLVLIGVADIVRAATRDQSPSRRGRAIAAVAVAWALIAWVAWLGLGLPLWGVLIEVVGATVWIATTRSGRASRAVGRWFPVAGLAAGLAALVLGGGVGAEAGGFVGDWYRGDHLEFLRPVPLAAVVAGIGSALFLIESANVIVTSALPTGVQKASAPPAVAKRRWRQAPAPEQPRPEPLKGGRMIGPIERLLLAGFTLAGAWPVVAALIAAKGIVRFPEINKASGGDQAEYFLIGSLVSWACAFALAGLCWVLALA